MGRAKLTKPWSRLGSPGKGEGDGVFALLFERDPELARREMRTITVHERGGRIPPGVYNFTEAFCSGKACDCRRVMFMVYREDPDQPRVSPRLVTVIGYGWEPLATYVTWMHGDVAGAKFMKGPSIEPNSPACAYGAALLETFTSTCLSSPDFVDRLRRHYKIFKDFDAR